MIDKIYVAAPIVLEGSQLDNMYQVASNMHERGQPIAGNCLERGLAIDSERGPTSTVRPSLTSPTPSCIYKRAQQPRMAEFPQWQSSPLPSPPSHGVLALQEVLSITLKRLLPPYPCIGHHSPPSPSAASFRHAPSRESIDSRPPWPSKGPACICLW